MQAATETHTLSTFTRRILVISLVVHLWAAWATVGFFHYDEHFQILEWAGSKLGLISPDDLAWEFKSQIRPWLLPAVFTGVFKVLASVGITNPFHWATFARFLSALLGWLSVCFLVQACRGWFIEEKWRKWAIAGAALVWYLPYLHARTSSENWSGSLFLIGFTLLVLAVQRQGLAIPVSLSTAWLSGLLMGLGFQCRFQMGIAVLATFCWAIWMARVGTKAIIAMALGVGIAISLGAVADYWGYGEWVFPAWKYFYVNLVEGKATQWGTSPAGSYLVWLFFRNFPLGFVLSLGMVFAWFLKPKLSLTWVTLSFFAVHSVLAHKEFRFLFPLAPLLPILAVFGYRAWANRSQAQFFVAKKLFLKWGSSPVALKALVGINALVLVVVSSTPANPEVKVLERIYATATQSVYFTPVSPYQLAGLPVGFYKKPGIAAIPIEALAQSQSPVEYLYAPNDLMVVGRKCQRVSGTVPSLFKKQGREWFPRITQLRDLSFYRCELE